MYRKRSESGNRDKAIFPSALRRICFMVFSRARLLGCNLALRILLFRSADEVIGVAHSHDAAGGSKDLQNVFQITGRASIARGLGRNIVPVKDKPAGASDD